MGHNHHHRLPVVAALALLMLVGPVVAQVFFPARRVVPSLPASSDITLPGDPFYWWVFDDEATNYSGIASWTDRIQGLQFVQASAGSQPVNTPEGVYLTQDRFMTNTRLAAFTNYTFVFILTPKGRATSMGSLWGWSPSPGAPYGVGLGATTNWITVWGGNTFVQSGTLNITSIYDLTITAQSYSGGTSTNMVTDSYVDGASYTNYVRGNEASVLTNNWLGDDDPFNDYSTVFLREIVVYTNQLSASDVSQVHQYRTNKYPTVYATYPSLNTSLVAHWSLDEASGTRADCINGNDLAETNTVGSVAGKINNAATFVRANSEALLRASTADLVMGDIDMSGSVWAYLDGVGDATVIAKWGGAGGREYRVFYDNGAVRFKFEVSGDGTASTQVTWSANASFNVWTHVYFQHDATANQIGISINNGTLVTAAHSTGIFAGTTAFAIGGREPAAAQFFNGPIDEPSLWKRLLTTDERAAVYNFGWARPGCPSY